eukprot:16226835-Heterocapsa_arctica.AAC.1
MIRVRLRRIFLCRSRSGALLIDSRRNPPKEVAQHAHEFSSDRRRVELAQRQCRVAVPLVALIHERVHGLGGRRRDDVQLRVAVLGHCAQMGHGAGHENLRLKLVRGQRQEEGRRPELRDHA